MNSTMNLSVREVAVLSPLAVSVLEKHGIDYCCGGQRPLEDACAEKGIEPGLLMREINTAMNGSAEASIDWRNAPLPELIHHIVTTHHSYARRELSMLEQRMATVLRVHGKSSGEVLEPLARIFAQLKQEFEAHLQKEELVLFPSIERATTRPSGGIGVPHFESPIQMMEHEHDAAGFAFSEMRRLTDNYTLPEHACTTYRALYAGLEAFERDTHQHVHLENNILFPRALSLNQN